MSPNATEGVLQTPALRSKSVDHRCCYAIDGTDGQTDGRTDAYRYINPAPRTVVRAALVISKVPL